MKAVKKKNEEMQCPDRCRDPDGNGAILSPASDNEVNAAKTCGGSKRAPWNYMIMRQTIAANQLSGADAEQTEQRINAALSGLMGIKPQDELEAMLAAQMISAHNLAMENYRLAMIDGQPYPIVKDLLNQANKLSRTCTSLMAAIDKHRGKGQQKVTVEYVHVHEGGQAIIGRVELPGGGGKKKHEE